MSIKRFFTQKALIQRSYEYSDGAGYHELRWKVIYGVKGKLDMLGGSKVNMADADGLKSTHVFLCSKIHPSIVQGDRLIVDEKVYDITFIDDPVSRGHHIEIMLNFNSILDGSNILDNFVFDSDDYVFDEDIIIL